MTMFRLAQRLWPITVALPLSTCGGLAQGVVSPPQLDPGDQQSTCKIQRSQDKPLIVEWPSAARAELEAVAQRSPVVVRYDGCEMDLLSRCRAPGGYRYTAVTPKRDTVEMSNADELYATIPMGAPRFESKLAASGKLNVDMTTVGRFSLARDGVARSELEGVCQGATHVVVGMTVGAFEFYAGASGEASGGLSAAGASAGAGTEARHETLTADGDRLACAAADDEAPPSRCGALMRIEVLPLGAKIARAQCPADATWNGSQCLRTEVVTQRECPAGSTWDGARCLHQVTEVQCPPGSAWRDGACRSTKVVDEVSCPDGSSWNGTHCVADPKGTRRPRKPLDPLDPRSMTVTVWVLSTVDGGYVYLDGGPRGRVPTKASAMSVGDHLLTLETPGYPECRWWLRDTRLGDTIRVQADPTKAKPGAKAPCGTVTVQ